MQCKATLVVVGNHSFKTTNNAQRRNSSLSAGRGPRLRVTMSWGLTAVEVTSAVLMKYL